MNEKKKPKLTPAYLEELLTIAVEAGNRLEVNEPDLVLRKNLPHEKSPVSNGSDEP